MPISNLSTGASGNFECWHCTDHFVISPNKIVLSVEPDTTVQERSEGCTVMERNNSLSKKYWKDLPIGSVGENRTSFTLPLCPGNLYSIFLESTSQMATVLSPLPAATLSPCGDQLARIRFFSIPTFTPSAKVCNRRFVGANARISHILTELSMEFDSRD